MLLKMLVESLRLQLLHIVKDIKFRLTCVSRHSVREKYQKIRKIAEITLIATKIGYTQFAIFGDIGCSRNCKLIC